MVQKPDPRNAIHSGVIVKVTHSGYMLWDLATNRRISGEDFPTGMDERTKWQMIFEAGRRYQAQEWRRVLNFGLTHHTGKR
jgi:hypothetical protein